jgi:FkbM family methyltransferase
MQLPTGMAAFFVRSISTFESSAVGRWPGVNLLVRASSRLVPWFARLGFRPGVVEVHGIKIVVPESTIAGLGGEHHMALGTYELAETMYLRRNLEPGGGFIDAGSHIGYLSLIAGAKVGHSGIVISIEPTPTSVKALRSNVTLNGFDDRIRIVEKALSSSPGMGQLSVSSVSDMWNTLELGTLDEIEGSISVPVTTVDVILDEFEWPRIDILKLDVEGHEQSALSGAVRALETYPDLEVIFEVSGTSPERREVSLHTLRYMFDAGFLLYRFTRGGLVGPVSIEDLDLRMQRPRWQDALFNVLARRPA